MGGTSEGEGSHMSEAGDSCSSIAEQEQGLLGVWKEQDAEWDRDVLPRRKRLWRRAAWAFFATTLAVVAIIAFGVLLILGAQGKETVEIASGVRTNDYVLDPAWDLSAQPQRRVYEWTVRDQVHNPDGIFRPMILVNSQFPGPLIEANESDTIVVHVNNQAVNATSIHWHGIYQNGTNSMDGTVGITQCPIPPGGKFTYEFTITGQSGTYWWHAHQGVQSSDGLHGPLIIHNRNERKLQQIEYATDRVVLLADHYHELSSALLWQYLKPNMENAEPVPEGGLINGRSIRSCDDYPQRQCDNSSSHLGPVTFELERDKSHRLRFINVGAFAEFQVQIDEHELAVTEVDGTDVVPMRYHRININPAQRYSVVVTTNVTSADSFWLRARMQKHCFEDPPKTLQTDVMAIVRYRSDEKLTPVPTSVDWEEALEIQCKDMDTTELKPVEAIEAPADADAFFYFRTEFQIGSYRLSRGYFGGSTWRADARSPTLLRSIDGLAQGNASFTSAAVSEPGNGSAFVNDAAFDRGHELVLQTDGIQTIDILIANFDDGNHPIHLHGYKYFVLAQGHGYPPRKTALEGMTRDNVQPMYDGLDLSNPLRRDTAAVEAYGWILLRLIADNPGAWAFHCHVSWHTEAGLLMQLLTRSDEIASMGVPDANRALCAARGIEKGMGPSDEDYRDFNK